jgi:hypothetical protein
MNANTSSPMVSDIRYRDGIHRQKLLRPKTRGSAAPRAGKAYMTARRYRDGFVTAPERIARYNQAAADQRPDM